MRRSFLALALLALVLVSGCVEFGPGAATTTAPPTNTVTLLDDDLALDAPQIWTASVTVPANVTTARLQLQYSGAPLRLEWSFGPCSGTDGGGTVVQVGSNTVNGECGAIEAGVQALEVRTQGEITRLHALVTADVRVATSG